MNRRHAITVATLLSLLLALLVFAFEYRRLKKIERRGPTYESVSAELPGDADRVAAAINETFNVWADFDRPDRIANYPNKFPYGSHWSRFFLFRDRKSTRLNSSHMSISYAVFCLKKKK